MGRALPTVKVEMKRARQLIRANRVLLVILLVGLLARLVAALYLGNAVTDLPGTFDQISYHNLALRVSGGHGFSFDRAWWPMTGAGEPTAHWSYLYTLYLAAIYKIFGPSPLVARLIQVIVVGIGQPYLIYLIGRRVFGEIVGLAAAALTAGYSYFIYYSAALMTEPFYITAILASLYLTIRLAEVHPTRGRKLAIGLGVSIGTVVLLRQLYLLFVPFLLAWLLWVAHRRFGRWPVIQVSLATVVVVAMIAPFTIYNYSRFDRFVLLNTNAGYAFFWANHPVHGTQFQSILPIEMGTYQDLIPADLRHLDEASLDQALLKRGLTFVIEDPGRYLLLSLSRIPDYFKFWPSAESGALSSLARIASFGLMWPFMLCGLLYTVIRRRLAWPQLITDPATLLILFAVIYSAIHLLSWALIRYRLPVDAVLLLFAGLFIALAAKRFRDGHLGQRVAQPLKS